MSVRATTVTYDNLTVARNEPVTMLDITLPPKTLEINFVRVIVTTCIKIHSRYKTYHNDLHIFLNPKSTLFIFLP